MTSHVTNVHAVVRVDGEAIEVPPSTPLPEGVEPAEISRLLQFGVIREVEPEPAPTPKAGRKAKTTEE